MANEFVQTVADARVDARSLSEFVFKPAGFKVARRLAPPIDTLQFYINRFDATKATTDAYIATIPNIVNDAINNTAVEGGILADTFVVATESGRNQREVNRKTVYEYDTVADMLADTTIVIGKVVSTNGYHAKQDGGGAKYTISLTPTDYSIPLNNGLHAVFNDSFDIRRFGIVDNKDIDQTEAIGHMCRYADEKRIYTINFHNFSLRVPKNQAFKTWRSNQLEGMWFKKPHELLNLKISYDKSGTLKTGQNAIMFLPDEWLGHGVFRLINVEFDILVMDYTIVNFESDGLMAGFHSRWQESTVIDNYWGGLFNTIKSGYSLHFENVHFKSAGTVRNLDLAGLLAEETTFINVTGDYWGLFANTNSYDLYAERMHGICRDDLSEGTDREGVKSLIHDEAEIGGYTANKNKHHIKDSSAHYLDGTEGVLYKVHRIGVVNIEEVLIESSIGQVGLAGVNTAYPENLLTVNTMRLRGFDKLDVSLAANVNNLFISDINELDATGVLPVLSEVVSISNIRLLTRYLGETKYGTNIGTLNLKYIDGISAGQNALISATGLISNINMTNVNTNELTLLRCAFNSVSIDNLQTNRSSFVSNFINNTSGNAHTISISRSSIVATGAGRLVPSANNTLATLSISNSYIEGVLLDGLTATTSQMYSKTKHLHTFATIAVNTTTSYDFNVLGAVIGNTVELAFTQPLQGTMITAEVVSAGVVRVNHHNFSAASVSIPRGDLMITIK